MARTITVTGIGHASVKPDKAEILFFLETTGKNYDKIMAQTAERCSKMSAALLEAGFDKDSLKTISFDIRTAYGSIPEKQHSHTKVLEEYTCSHRLKMVLDFHAAVLSDALRAVVRSKANPEIRIHFTAENTDAVTALILQNAASDARKKAEVLCKASGVTLGALCSIHDNRSNVKFASKTIYNYDEDSITAGSSASCSEITPDDIEITDSVTFVWEIL